VRAQRTVTRDAAGRVVDWTRPPYRVGGLLRLVLEGEDPQKIPSAVSLQRICEYYRAARRWV
jgi:hypothetical protein